MASAATPHSVQHHRYYIGDTFVVEHAPSSFHHVCPTAILILPAMGYEDTCSYRPLRHLADALAQAGHVVLRLDWPGLGDSAGENALPQQISHCTQSIQAAIQQLKNRGFAQVAAIGLRIGGLLALSVPELDALALLLLPQRGKAYLREERAFHKMAAQAFGPPPADAPVLPAQAVEAGGFVYAPEAVLALEALVAADLAAQSRCKRVLLVEAEGRNPATAVAQAFEQAGASVSVTQGNFGNLFENAYIASMDPKVQQEILAWFETTDRCAIAPPQSPTVLTLPQGVVESPWLLKAGGGELSGIVCAPTKGIAPGATWTLFLNAGGIRRAGPSRLWTQAARALATLGQPSLRFDVRDVGDSEGALQPHLDLDAMYSEGTVEDALRAYDWVQTQKPGKIQVIGLCLGAFLGMQLTARRPVSRAVLFNGLAFVWNEEARASSMTAHIRGSLLDGRRWRRLLTGKIDARALAEAILQKTRLNAKRGLLKLQGKPPPNPVAELIATVQARGTNLQLISSEGDPSITYLESNVPQEQRPTLTIFGGVDHTLRPVWSHARVDALRASLSAVPREDTQLIEITVSDRDPVRAATLANLTAQVYCESNLEARTDAAQKTRGWLDEQLRNYRGLLDTANQKVMAFKSEHNLINVDESVDGISSRMNALQAALGDATTQQVLLESKLNEHQRLLSKGSYDVLAGMFQNPEMAAMAQAHATITTEASEVLERYGEQHPEHQRAQARIRHVDQLMATEVRQNVQGERSQLQTLLSQITDINRELSKVKDELLEKQRLQGSYTELKLEAERTQKIYDSLSARRMEVDLQAQSHLNDVHVVDKAQAPTHPSSPNIPLNLAMALGVGLGGGLGLALLRQRLNSRILSVADLEYFLKSPILGIIPSFPSVKIDNSNRSLYTFSHPRSTQAEAFRSIRTTLNTPYRNKSQRILVTSCQEGEGKSLVATNLAIAYAQMGARVLLVDAQLRRPRIHTIFGVPHSPGLADGFADCFVDQELTRRFPWRNSVARRTHIPRLHILPAGQHSTYPNEVLSSPELERLLRRLDSIYEVVIIDTPPVNNFSDTLALARAADGVLLVLRHGHVPSRIATKVFQQLRQANAKILGIAFNDVPTGLQ